MMNAGYLGRLKPISFALLVSTILCSCSENILPQEIEALPGCSTDIMQDLPNWFGGEITNNGFVSPSEGAQFNGSIPNPEFAIGTGLNGPEFIDDFCLFQAWSARMFLWLTSPANRYGGFNSRVFNSRVFYAVGDYDAASGGRSLISQTGGIHFKLSPTLTNNGPNKLPMKMSDDGSPYELIESELGAGKLPLVLEKGRRVEVSKIERTGKSVKLIGTNGQPIVDVRALVNGSFYGSRVAQAIRLNNEVVGLTSTGGLVSFGAGQADGFVLMAQTGSLVYYQTAVNSVYAHYLSMVKNQNITNTKFPTTVSELQQVIDYAANHYNTMLLDPEALAVEVKTSWVESSSLPHPEEYITMDATVPDYDKSNPNIWVLKPAARATNLAMVGMHVVGSVKDHPKMVWATFEHKRNTPNADYNYSTADGDLTVHDDPQTNPFLFSNANAVTINKPTMAFDYSTGNILPMDHYGNQTPVAEPGFSFLPTNLKRYMPWGSSSNLPNIPSSSSLNPVPIIDANVNNLNNQIIAVNNALHGEFGLHANDVRRNYNLIGTTWVFNEILLNTSVTTSASHVNWNRNGQAPQYDMTGTNIGTNQLSNSTMESFNQENIAVATRNNCLSCHVVSSGQPTTSISHIFDVLLPLPN